MTIGTVEYGDDGVALNILCEHDIDMRLDFGSNKNLLVELVSSCVGFSANGSGEGSHEIAVAPCKGSKASSSL
jgi:hypothetical protein